MANLFSGALEAGATAVPLSCAEANTGMAKSAAINNFFIMDL
jgi:hypothetical protein